MELFGLGLCILIAYGVIRLAAKVAAWFTGANYRAFRRLAAHHSRSRYETRGHSDSPIVSFPHGEDLVRVGLAPASPRLQGLLSTRIVVRFRRGIPFRMELTPRSASWQRPVPKGTQPIQIGDREFDGAFQILANDPEMARDALSPTARWAIYSLQHLVHPGGVMLTVSPERLLVQIDRNLGGEPESLLTAVQETLTIVRALREGVNRRITEGVTLIENDGAGDPFILPPVCKVCGETVDAGPMILCDKCGAPHHRDCWEFVGACSIYGCGGKTGRTSLNLPTRTPDSIVPRSGRYTELQ